jgi:hypothetical protein
VHAKTHGILQGYLEVDAGLPHDLAEGLFAKPGRYPVLMRFSKIPGDILDDSVSTPLGRQLPQDHRSKRSSYGPAMIALGRRDLAMAFGEWGRYANRTNLLSQCERFLISKEEGARILDEMTTAAGSTWYGMARQAGVSESDCELMRSAFVYEGFGYDLNDPQIQTDSAAELPTTRTAR